MEKQEFISKLCHIVSKSKSFRSVREAGWRLGQENSNIIVKRKTAESIVEFKNMIGGGFEVESSFNEGAKLINKRCPLGCVNGMHHVCGLTSGVLGAMIAENHGQASVDIKKSIARGDNHCEVDVSWSRFRGTGDRYLSTSNRYFSRKLLVKVNA